jgi:hypothetical protein
MVEYKLRVDNLVCEDEPYVAYGVDAIWNGEVVQSYQDIFFDYDKAVEFVDLLNSEELELIHLHDVIEDALI